MELGIDKIHEIATQWGVQVPDDEYSIIWNDVFPVDKKEESQELQSAVETGLISKLKAIMRYQNLNEEQATLELERINKENATIDESQLTV